MNGLSSEERFSTYVRSLAAWVVLICAEIIHGILRAVFLVPWVGRFRSNQIGVLTGSAIILVLASLMIPWIGAKQTRTLTAIGVMWLTLTVAFEVLFGRFVVGLSWQRIGSDYRLTDGGLMPLGLCVLLMSPLIGTKLRRMK